MSAPPPSASSTAWFTHRLDSWSKIAREKVKRAADLNNESPNTSSDDGSSIAVACMQKENSRDAQKSASSSFEVDWTFLICQGKEIFKYFFRIIAILHHRHRPHPQFCHIKANLFPQDFYNVHHQSLVRVASKIYIKCVSL